MITSTTSTSIAITWSTPANNGGSAVTSYSVMVSGGTTSTTTTTMTSTTISGLTPNTMYIISVSAVNSAGSGSSVDMTETTLLSGECVIIYRIFPNFLTEQILAPSLADKRLES